MSVKYGDWREDALSQLKVLISEHQQQRTQLELNLETTPRDSRYSSNLVGLMKAEEDNTGKDKMVLVDLNRKVDEALSLETHKFFEKTAAQNIKRWKALSQKLDLERQKYRMQLSDQIMRVNPNHTPVVGASSNGCDFSDTSNLKVSVGTNKRILTAEDLDEESLRLEQDYNRNFMAYEGFNLSEAFQSHRLKVDKDWSVHELLLEEDYKSRRHLITGSEEVKTVASHVPDTQENRWQHPEKQKTLIHTAPVLSPTLTTALASSSSAGSAIRAVRGRGRDDAIKNNRELERLDRQYAVALESLADQKNGAMRWMARQKIRLVSQTEECRAERTVIALMVDKQRRDVKAIKDILQTFALSTPHSGAKGVR